MYEARQNKEKVNRRIEGGSGIRKKQMLRQLKEKDHNSVLLQAQGLIHNSVIQRQPLVWAQIKDNPEFKSSNIYSPFFQKLINDLIFEYPHIKNEVEDIYQECSGEYIAPYNDDDMENIILRINSAIEKVEIEQFRGMIATTTNADKFIANHPGAILVDLNNSVNQQFNIALPNGIQHIISQALRHTHGNLPTYEGYHVYHDTHHTNFTVFLIVIDDQPILVSTGMHPQRNRNDVYKLSWCCDGNNQWQVNYYIGTNYRGPQAEPL
ncbi:hypothetical protein [Bacteroides sp. An19]|uniref:hypothetical protein n=1 Tax=Bacteroides sp. An19 TaxID=1965580 RepID=UPI000B39F775|nr:hypothetical protein [Bacteroides sp. An19]OUP30525.1 hypothetical protein B5F25_14555 [Bacteroides sp. An19]